MNILIVILLVLIITVLILIKDLKNYFFARSCFKECMKNRPLQIRYNFKMTFLGVMYTIYKVPASTPEQYHKDLLIGYLLPIDEALTVMNLDGIVHPAETRKVGTDGEEVENEERFTYYLIKFVPAFEKLNFWLIIKVIGFTLLSIYLINKFKVFDGKDAIIESVQGVLNSSLDELKQNKDTIK